MAQRKILSSFKKKEPKKKKCNPLGISPCPGKKRGALSPLPHPKKKRTTVEKITPISLKDCDQTVSDEPSSGGQKTSQPYVDSSAARQLEWADSKKTDVRLVRKPDKKFHPKQTSKSPALKDHLEVDEKGKRQKGFKLDENLKPPAPKKDTSPSTVILERLLQETALQVRLGDLTKESCDAIVNAANGQLNHMAGVAGAIRKTGGPSIQRESFDYVRKNGPVEVGCVAVTKSGNLNCGIVIHAVGPRYHSSKHRLCCKQLASSVTNSLRAADKQGLESIAFPAISSGIFGFPKEQCAKIMIRTAMTYIRSNKNSSVKQIRFTNIDWPTVRIFETTMKHIAFGSVSKHPTYRKTEAKLPPEPSNTICDQQKKSAVVVRWQWKADLMKSDSIDAVWESYSKEESDIIETQFTKDTTGDFVLNETYKIDLDFMHQYRSSDPKRKRKIRRLVS